MSEVWVAVVKHPGQSASFQPVGIFAGETLGTGDAWEATAWTASFMAPNLLNRDMGSRHVEFWTDGAIDGPSAGALLTVAIVALERNQVSLRKAVTMTGTIEPDGSIGEVGGIPKKIDAAAAAGFKTVLVPASQLLTTDPQTGEVVDLAAIGSNRGVVVEGVNTIWEAYPKISADPEPLAPPPSVSPDSIELSQERRTMLAEAAHAWIDRLERDKAGASGAGLSGPLSVGLGTRWEEYYSKALVELSSQSPAAALWYAKQARLYQFACIDLADMERSILGPQSGGDDVVRKILDRLAERSDRLEKARKVLSGRNVESMAGVTFLVHLHNQLFSAGFTSTLLEIEMRKAVQLLRGRPLPEEEQVRAIVDMFQKLAILLGQMQLAEESVEIYGDDFFRGEGEDTRFPLPQELRRTTERYDAVGKANWGFLESTFFAQAGQAGLSAEELEGIILLQDPSLLFYRGARRDLAEWKAGITRGDTAEARLTQLASARLMSDLSAFLITKYEALGTHADASGRLVAGDVKALDEYLQRALQLSAAYIAYLRRVAGTAPIATEMAFLQAKLLMNSSEADRLEALELFWRAVEDVRMCMSLGRGLPKPSEQR